MELRGEPILLVEDDPNDQILVRRAFKKAGITNPIRVVSDGDAAVAYLSGGEPYADREANPLPALVMLDIKLPRRSGHEVLAWLRAREEVRRIPVVMLTSSADRGDVDRAYDLGANSYLMKPVVFDEFIEMARSLGMYWTVWNRPPSAG